MLKQFPCIADPAQRYCCQSRLIAPITSAPGVKTGDVWMSCSSSRGICMGAATQRGAFQPCSINLLCKCCGIHGLAALFQLKRPTVAATHLVQAALSRSCKHMLLKLPLPLINSPAQRSWRRPTRCRTARPACHARCRRPLESGRPAQPCSGLWGIRGVVSSGDREVIVVWLWWDQDAGVVGGGPGAPGMALTPRQVMPWHGMAWH